MKYGSACSTFYGSRNHQKHGDSLCRIAENTYERIRLTMIMLGLIHCDETGTRVDEKTLWAHVASNQNYTYLTINQKRGQIGMDAANMLPHFQGITVHNCWLLTGSIRM